MHKSRVILSLVIFGLGVFGAPTPARGVTAQNQCPGDCSPCLGTGDPFCDSTGGEPNAKCWACHWIDEGNGIFVKACDSTAAGEAGHTGCKEDLPFMASCTFSGSGCTGTTTP